MLIVRNYQWSKENRLYDSGFNSENRLPNILNTRIYYEWTHKAMQYTRLYTGVKKKNSPLTSDVWGTSFAKRFHSRFLPFRTR